MCQLWVLPADISPLDALQNNHNPGACGHCPLQGVYDESSAG